MELFATLLAKPVILVTAPSAGKTAPLARSTAEELSALIQQISAPISFLASSKALFLPLPPLLQPLSAVVASALWTSSRISVKLLLILLMASAKSPFSLNLLNSENTQ